MSVSVTWHVRSNPGFGIVTIGRKRRSSVVQASPSNSTIPRSPSTRTRWPSAIAFVAPLTETTAGRPYSRATSAPWVNRPPTSATNPPAVANRGVQAGSVEGQTRISPAARSASAGSWTIRAVPSTVPEETPVPPSAFAPRSARSARGISPSLVISGGASVRFWRSWAPRRAPISGSALEESSRRPSSSPWWRYQTSAALVRTPSLTRCSPARSSAPCHAAKR